MLYLAPEAETPDWLALRSTEFELTPQFRSEVERHAAERDSSGFERQSDGQPTQQGDSGTSDPRPC